MKIKILILSLAAVLYCMSASADMYKWVDNSGVTHYAQLPPDGVDAEILERSGGKRSTNQRFTENQQDDDIDNEEDLTDIDLDDEFEDDLGEQVALAGEEALKNAEELAAAEKKRVEAEERTICEQATKNLIAMESRPIVRIKDGDDFRVLTAQEKAAKTAETRVQITKYCR